MKLVQLPELQTGSATSGGVRITSNQTSENLVINGSLEDQTTGYSANIPFSFEPVGTDAPEPRTIAELGLMTGAADPMMLFPAGTTFTPYSILRNVSNATLSVNPTLWWMEGGKPHSAILPAITLQPLQTQSLDVASLVRLPGSKNFNGSFNIEFSTVARRGSLVMSSGSVDQTSNYVFEVIPRGVAESASKSLQQWSTGNGDDTMVTIWNPADETQDFVFTLFFDGGHYLLPLHLQARETRAFNVSEIIENQVPDAEGNLIPPDVKQGTAKLSGSLAENQHILVALEAGVYNVRKATCGVSCQNCNGYTAYVIDLGTFGVTVNGTQQETAMGTYYTGAQYNMTGTSSWTSSNHSVFTVSAGLVKGVAGGKATTTGTTPDEPIQVGYYCTGGTETCPESPFSNNAGGTTTPTITSLDPDTIMIGTAPPGGKLTINGSGFGTTPTVNLPSGVTSTGSASTDSQMVLTGVNVALSATVGDNNVTVTANGATSAPGTLTVDGPYQMVVQSDVLGKCSGCNTTVERVITYQVQNWSGSAAQNVWIGEATAYNGWSCNQSNPGTTTTPCSQNYTIANGVLTDHWYMGSDSYTPVGCGFNVTYDNWQSCAHSPADTLGSLSGYIHTNAISENGVVSPPSSFPYGTVLPF